MINSTPLMRILILAGLGAVLLVSLGAGHKRHTLSPVIYPGASKLLRFNHLQHNKTDCLACHRGISESVNARELHLPTESRCRECHASKTRQNDLQKSSADAGCTFCHVGYKGQGIPERSVFPAANIRFNHRLHLQKGASCAGCHDLTTAQPSSPFPTMRACQSCHRAEGASTRCVVCHLAQKDGRLITKLAVGKLLPSGELQGDAHNELFYRKHSAVARSAGKYCENCHTSQSCARCHNSTLRPMAIHGNDYIRLHSLDARQKRTRCSSCHRTQSFCLGCHQRLGVGTETTQSGFKPHTNRAFHGPGYATYEVGPGHHSFQARRNISTCTSCHQEKTCIQCHGSQGLRHGGISPHGPNFGTSLKCRTLSSRNQRVCLKCHLVGDTKIQCW